MYNFLLTPDVSIERRSRWSCKFLSLSWSHYWGRYGLLQLQKQMFPRSWKFTMFMAKFMRQMPLIRQIQILLGRTGWALTLNDGEKYANIYRRNQFSSMKTYWYHCVDVCILALSCLNRSVKNKYVTLHRKLEPNSNIRLSFKQLPFGILFVNNWKSTH